jgi:hypothetical protein
MAFEAGCFEEFTIEKSRARKESGMPHFGWHGSVLAAMLTRQDMTAENDCLSTQIGFFRRYQPFLFKPAR